MIEESNAEVIEHADNEQGKVVNIPENYKASESEDVEENQENYTEPNNAKTSNNQSEQKLELKEGQWLIKEGVLGSGDRPSFLLEKYGYNMESQAKAYPDASKKIGELNQRLGAFTGAPDQYDFSSIEKDGFEFDKQDKLYNEFITECKNSNISQDFALKIAGFAKQLQDSPMTNHIEEAKNYGHTFKHDTKHISNWITNNVENKNDATELTNSIQTAGALRALKNLMEKNGFSIPGNEVEHVPRETLKDLKQEFAENLYSGENLAKNPEKVQKWREKFKKHSG